MCFNSGLRASAGSRFTYIAWSIVIGILWATGCGMGTEPDLIGSDDTGTLDSTVIPDDTSTEPDLLDPAEVEAPSPTLSFSAGPVFCCNPLSIEFAAEASSDNGWGVTSFAWDYGDGYTAVGQNVVHTYRWFGEYMVVLTANRPGGVTETIQQVLSITQDEYYGTEVVVTPPAPVLPVAQAGLNQSVLMGDTVVLDGSGSTSATGQALVYGWVQTGGPAVELNPADQAVVSFTAPQVEGEREMLTFVLSVTEDELQASDEVLVEVLGEASIAEINTPPTASDQSVSLVVGNAAVLTLVGNDADGDDLTFSIVDGPEYGTLGSLDTSDSGFATVSYTPGLGFEGTDTFAFQVNDGGAASNVATATLVIRKALLPWVEINMPLWDAMENCTEEEGAEPGMTFLDYCLAGLDYWSSVTDQAIITTHPGQFGRLYPDLMSRKPANMTILGGVKPFQLPGVAPYDPETYNYSDADGWLELASIAQQIVEMTGTNVFVIENEIALLPFHQGEEEIDLEELRDSLVPLRDTGVEVWWHLPHILVDTPLAPNRRADTTALVTAVSEALPDCVFFAGNSGAYGWSESLTRVELREEMIDLVGVDRLRELLFVTSDGYMDLWSGGTMRSYTVAESLVEMQSRPQGPIGLYPGVNGWILMAREFADALPPLASSIPLD